VKCPNCKEGKVIECFSHKIGEKEYKEYWCDQDCGYEGKIEIKEVKE